jgi:glucokinase
MAEQCVIGFDMGGTKMIAAVVDASSRIVGRARERTGAEDGAEAVYERVVAAIRGALEKARKPKIKAIGIAAPGPLDRRRGIIVETPNMGLRKFPIADRLRREFGVPVVLENDVNAGVYGEYKAGAARGYSNVVGIFIGTGIGGGIVLDGRLYIGATGNAGEIGHMIIQTDGALCGCGQHGCVEALASRTAIAKDVAALAGSGASQFVREEVGTDLKGIRSGVLAGAIAKGDRRVRGVVERAAHFVGIAMANCANLLGPEVIVLGGGLLEKIGPMFLKEAERSMREHAMESVLAGVKVVLASLGDDAVPIGVATLAREPRARA